MGKKKYQVCRKVPLETRKLANKEAKKWRNRTVYLKGKLQRKKYLRVYRCKNCDAWHLTSQK